MQNQNVTHQARQLESELGGEDSPSTVDSRVSHSNMSIYGQDLMPIHPTNIALMNPTPMGGAYSASGNTSEKKPQQPQTLAFKSSDVSFFCNFICFHQWNHSFPRSWCFIDGTESCSSPKPSRDSKSWLSLHHCGPSNIADELLLRKNQWISQSLRNCLGKKYVDLILSTVIFLL